MCLGVGPRKLLKPEDSHRLGVVWREWSSAGIQVERTQGHEFVELMPLAQAAPLSPQPVSLVTAWPLRGLFRLDTIVRSSFYLSDFSICTLPSYCSYQHSGRFPSLWAFCCLFIYCCCNWIDSSYRLSLNS